jgi:hypothetical protein
MKIRKLLVAGVMAGAAVGIVPAPASAVECLPPGHEAVIGKTCWDCGWVMIRGEGHVLFYCD